MCDVEATINSITSSINVDQNVVDPSNNGDLVEVSIIDLSGPDCSSLTALMSFNNDHGGQTQ